MEKVLYNTVFNRKNLLLPNGTALIQIEAYERGKKKYFSTKVYITPEQWDKKHRNIKNHPNQISLNKQIKDFANSLENAEMQRRQSGKPFTLDYLSEFVNGNCSNSFVEFCTRELQNAKIRHNTVVEHRTTIKYLKQFKKDVMIDGITFEYLTDFELFLSKKQQHKNTIAKHLMTVRRYVNLAINKELFDLNKYPFRKFKIKKVKTKRDYLTPDELERLENFILPDELKECRLSLDKYLFACYTGLRYSDVSALRPENLVMEDGKEWLNLTMKKTEEAIRLPIYLPVFSKALDFIYSYIGKQLTIFPFQQNRAINNDLKAIAIAAEVNKKVTFHTARHTQATILLYKGVNITTVQKLLGHKRIETTQIYSKVMDMTIINELKNVSFSR